MDERRLTCCEIETLLASLIASNTAASFDRDLQSLAFRDADGYARLLTMPLILADIVHDDLADILTQIRQMSRRYTIILVQAGAAALGYVEDDEMVHHKVIRKYMVRQKQGKSQLKYLKSKGKSRLGSRIRLKNSIAFFEEINRTLIDWEVATKSDTLLLFLPVNLKHLFFSANIPPPFDRKDSRIRKVPLDIRLPNFKELSHVDWVVRRGVLRCAREV